MMKQLNIMNNNTITLIITKSLQSNELPPDSGPVSSVKFSVEVHLIFLSCIGVDQSKSH